MPGILDYAFAPAWARGEDERIRQQGERDQARQARMTYLDQMFGAQPENEQDARLKQLLSAPDSMTNLRQLGAQQLGRQWFPQENNTLPEDIQKYEYAKKQGYKGSYADWAKGEKGGPR